MPMIDWTPLRAELAIWRAEERQIPIWWRDDDAVGHTPELEHLIALSQEVGVPVHLAIIPAHATDGLKETVQGSDHLIPLVHGWAHVNHSPPALKKAEFGAVRDKQAVQKDIASGFEKMTDLFGANLCPIFVPPWNRVDPAYLPMFAAQGYRAISTYLPRRQIEDVPGLENINTHVDPIAWKTTRGLVRPEHLIARTVQLLQDRRSGITDASEPLGYLTHHLVHDAAIWDFSRQFLSELREGPTIVWALK